VLSSSIVSLGRLRLGERREAADVREHHRRTDALAAEREARPLQVLRDLRCREAAHHRLLLVAQALLLEARVDPRAQQHGIDGLRQVILGAELDAAHDARRVFERRRDDDRQVAQLQVADHPLEHFEAVHFRHLHVEQHEVEALAVQHLQRDSPVLGGSHRMSLQLEVPREQQAIDLVVVDDEQPRAA
jgi:hypothetical protein